MPVWRILIAIVVVLGMSACGGTPAAPTAAPPNTPGPVPPVAPTASPVAVAPAATPTGVPATTLTAAATPTTIAAATSVSTPTLPRPTAPPSPLPTLGVTLPITTWTVDTLLVGPGNPGRLYALQQGDIFQAAGTDGLVTRLLTSDDFGETWRPFPGGLPTTDAVCLHGLSMDYAQVEALYAGTCQGIYRWTGAQWVRISQQAVGKLALAYGEPNLMWATGTGAGPSILRSEDGGVTWQRADTDLGNVNVYTIGIDPRESKTIYATLWPKVVGDLRRGDASGRWVTMPLPEAGNTYIGVTIDGATGALYVATLGSPDRHWRLWRSPNPADPDLKQVRWETVHDFGDDSAYTWPIVLASGSHPQGLALFVRFDAANCSLGKGTACASAVQRSLDGGKTWSAVPLPTK